MRLRNFFSITTQKVILFVFLTFFAPVPFYLALSAGFYPPVIVLYFLIKLTTDYPGIIILTLPVAIIHLSLVVLIACAINLLIQKTIIKVTRQWLAILLVAIMLVVLSFLPIYLSLNIGGGTAWENIFGLIEKF